MSGIAITFPSSAVEGQSYLAQNGFTYIYDSQKNRWKRGGEFVRAPKVLSYAGVAATTTGAGITTSPTGSLIYVIPGTVNPNSEVGVDSYKAYRAAESYPNYTEVQVSISSAFSSIAYAATFTGTTHTIPSPTLSGNTEYYLRARQFVGSSAAAASTGAISGYSANPVKFTTASVYLDTPTIVSIAGTTRFPVYQIGFAGTTLPATVTYGGGGVGNLDKVEWRVTGPRIPSSTGDTALAEVGIGTHSSATLANALVLAMPFSGASGVGITSDVNNAIRTASSASAGTTKTVTANGGIGTATVAGLALTSHFYPSAAYFVPASSQYLSVASNTDFEFGSGNFTIEWWEYVSTNHQSGIINRSGTTGVNGGPWIIIGRTSGNIEFYAYNSGTWDISNGTVLGTRTLNQWTHWALVRNGSVFRAYKNGVDIGISLTSSASFAASSNPLIIGNWDGTFNGYMQDVKLYKGLAKYTENFTPPLPTYGTISYTTGITNVGVATTAFFESTGDTPTAEVAIGSSTAAQVASSLVLAMPMNRTFGFQDINVAIRGLTSGASAGTAKTVGLGTTSTANAPTHPIISSTESKWYDGAAYFTVGDYATIFSDTDFDFGSSPFTMEAWIYPVSGTAQILVFDWRPGNTTGIVLINADGALAYWNYPTNVASTGKVQFNAWNHCAWVFSSSIVNFYINGIFAGSGSASVAQPDSSYITINGQSQGTFYIQDAKIYKGFAKYTADFTPPRPICGFTTDISTQTGFTTTTATGALLSSVVGLGSTSTLAFSADQNLVGVTSITSSSGITTLPDPYAQNLVLALPLANITGAGNSFTNDRNTQIRSVSITGAGVTAGTTKTITNTGVSTVVMGSTSKWYGNSAYFDGSSYVTVANNGDFDFGNNNFTIELWLNTSNTSTCDILGYYSGGGFGFIVGNPYGIGPCAGSITIFTDTAGGTNLNAPCGTVSANVWTHIAVVRNGSYLAIYKDGVIVASQTGLTSSIVMGTTQNIGVGRMLGSLSRNVTGYIQDLKIYKGFAKYTANFTPPPPMFGDYTRSTPNKLIFTPSSDYVLEARNTSGITTSSYSATRQWGTAPAATNIADPFAEYLTVAIPGGAYVGIITAFDVSAQIKQKYVTSTYSSGQIVGKYTSNTTIIGGSTVTSTTQSKFYGRSTFFPGDDVLNYIEIGNSPRPITLSPSSKWTIEGWFYIPSGSIATHGISILQDTDLFSLNYWTFSIDTSQKFAWYWYPQGNGIWNSTFATNQWNHVAFVGQGNGIVDLFYNGTKDSSPQTLSVTPGTTNRFQIGSIDAISSGAYMTDFRCYNGIAKYTSNFTPPNQIYI